MFGIGGQGGSAISFDRLLFKAMARTRTDRREIEGPLPEQLDAVSAPHLAIPRRHGWPIRLASVAERASMVRADLQAGIIDVNEARVARGYAPDETEPEQRLGNAGDRCGVMEFLAHQRAAYNAIREGERREYWCWGAIRTGKTIGIGAAFTRKMIREPGNYFATNSSAGQRVGRSVAADSRFCCTGWRQGQTDTRRRCAVDSGWQVSGVGGRVEKRWQPR